MYPYARAFFLIGNSTYKRDLPVSQGGREDKTSLTSIGVQLGSIFMISDAVGGNVSLRFSKDKEKDKNAHPAGYTGKTEWSGTTITFGVSITAFTF